MSNKRIDIVKEIPKGLFDQIVQSVPLATSDAIIKTDEGVLLGKRRNNPAKGEYFTIGGRMYFGETPEETAIRKARKEAGLEIRIIRPTGIYSLMYPKAYQDLKYPAHYIAYFFLAELVGGSLSQKDSSSDLSDFRLLKGIDDMPLHPLIRKVLEDSHVFEKGKKRPLKFAVRNLFFE